MNESSPADAAAPNRTHRTLSWLRREVMPLVVMLLLLTVARASFANHYQVPSGSMEYTLTPGDRVAVDMSAYGVRLPFTEKVLIRRGQPQRGDVVVFDSPADGVRLIKRLVALPGDRVELHDGRLTINGIAQAKPEDADIEIIGAHQAQLNLDAGGGPDIDGITLPPGQALVMGDHRGNSFDGRFFGFVRLQAFYGKATAVYYRRGEGFGWRRL